MVSTARVISGRVEKRVVGHVRRGNLVAGEAELLHPAQRDLVGRGGEHEDPGLFTGIAKPGIPVAGHLQTLQLGEGGVGAGHEVSGQEALELDRICAGPPSLAHQLDRTAQVTLVVGPDLGH